MPNDDLFFGDLENRRGELERHQENSGRIAEAFARFTSTGQGSIEFGDRVEFDVTFVEEPFMSYGAYIDLDKLDDLLGNEPGSLTPEMPITSGFVTDWDRDDRGFYVGAWVGVRVWFPYEANTWPDIEVEMVHHYTFKAIAIKDVPHNDRDQ
jgi:hypothetical protein